MENTHKNRCAVLLAGAALYSLMAPAVASAQTNAPVSFNLPRQTLDASLKKIAAASGWEIMFAPSDVEGVIAPELSGDMTPRDAIHHLLNGSRLVATFSDGNILIRGRTTASTPIALDDGADVDIIVTGSHIRGAPSSSPVNSMTVEDMKKAGQTNLGEVIRSIPQNFSGGQNPGVATGAGVTNSNVNAASSLNLRGLGADATLTLLNGHRLPYDSAFAGVDISAIPLAAVDRIEIVADGSSALYGSDAVGGVANVILKRDFDGVEATARAGASTDGGNIDEQFNVVGGSTWTSGGFLLAYDFQHNSAISARQRSYTNSLDDEATLYPEQRRHAVLLAGHQGLTDTLEFKVDALYNKRWSTFLGAPTKGKGYAYNGQRSDNTVETYSIAPSLTLTLPNRWQIEAQLFYGRDNTRYNGIFYSPTAAPVTTVGCYCADAYSAELTADGPLIKLPGGDIRVAAGVGYRSNGLDYQRVTAGSAIGPFNVMRDSYYAYGEVFIPLVSPAQGIGGISRLNVTGALRYEKYLGLAEIGTPKLGLIYAPTDDLDFKGSWGKSFKAPTLYQQNLTQEAYLFPAASFGTGQPAGSFAMYTSGGNAMIIPERATSWTATASLHPRLIKGLKIEASYFNIRYKDRVVQPIISLAGILNNAAYADLLTSSPSAALQKALIAGTAVGLRNLSGQLYDPARVVALIDNRYRNVAEQKIQGVDVYTTYRMSFSDERALTFTGSGTYLKSKQQLTKALPSANLAGIIFHPPHVRARAGAVWETPRVNLSGFINYVGPVLDNRPTPIRHVRGSWTGDVVGRINLGGAGLSNGGFDLSLSILNLLNDKPATIYVTGSTDTPYDSTNYSPIGRFISLTISKAW